LSAHGDALYRYAFARVRDSAQAEDLVQETLLAALESQARFAGRAAERTWLIGILKHKLIDQLRRRNREPPLADLAKTDDEIEALFSADGHWKSPPAAWSSPMASLEQREFWRVLSDCLAALPARQAQAFSLSEFDGFAGEELCKLLDATATNVWVMLHRARLHLRECLEQRWFGREG
jgi:RNA polymerase sigma-70 factor (ECF subfamily)